MTIFTTQKEIDERLDSENNVLFKTPGPTGKKEGDTNLTTDERKSVAVMANLVGNKATAEMSGVSYNHTLNLGKGIIAPIDGVNPELKREITDKIGPVIDLTLDKMIKSIGKVNTDHEKMNDPVQAAKVAKDLSTIHRNLNPDKDGGNQVQVNVVAYVPKQKSLDDYETQVLPKQLEEE
jgi:hypothetical protein